MLVHETAKPRPFKLTAWEATEFQIQVSLCDALRKFAAPNVLWFSVPNGETRTVQAGRRLKRSGTRAGVADMVFLRANTPPLFVELKTSRGLQSATQRAFQAQAIAAGAEYEICRSLDEALSYLWARGFLARKLV